jgi:hypothetical protein
MEKNISALMRSHSPHGTCAIGRMGNGQHIRVRLPWKIDPQLGNIIRIESTMIAKLCGQPFHHFVGFRVFFVNYAFSILVVFSE